MEKHCYFFSINVIFDCKTLVGEAVLLFSAGPYSCKGYYYHISAALIGSSVLVFSGEPELVTVAVPLGTTCTEKNEYVVRVHTAWKTQVINFPSIPSSFHD